MTITVPNTPYLIGRVMALTGSVPEMQAGPEGEVRYNVVAVSGSSVQKIAEDAIPPHRDPNAGGRELGVEVRAAPIGSPVKVWVRINDGAKEVWWCPDLEFVEFYDCEDASGGGEEPPA